MTGGLAFIFASYSLTRYLSEAAHGQFAFDLVAQMIGLRVVIALEVLVPLGLYLGIIIGLGRLYADQEMTALQAGGVTRARMLRALIGFALLVALLVAGLSIFVRPWAYGHLYVLDSHAQTQMNLGDIAPNEFYSDSGDGMVIYAGAVHVKANRLDNVFTSMIKDDRRVAIRAASMTRQQSGDGPPTLVFHDGHLYQIDRQGNGDRVLDFKTLDWKLSESPSVIGYKRKAASTLKLWHSSDPDDISERQWRFTRPVATLFLALLGIAFARAAPRRGRSANVFAATVCFVVYYNLAGVARTWVEHGTVPPIPGIYWVDGLVAVLLIALWLRPGMKHY